MTSRILPLLTVALLLILVALPLLFILLQALFPALAQGSLAGAFTLSPGCWPTRSCPRCCGAP